jgi:hypothetical protein
MHKSIVTTVLIAALAIAAACKKDQSATGADAKQAMGLYAKGFNDLLADPKRLIGDYFSSIPADKPLDFERKPSLMGSSFAASKIKEAREAFAAARDAAPESLAALAPAADAALAAADKAIAIYDTAYKYYEAETYKDDKGEQAKQLRDQMIAASKEFSGAINKLSDGMESIEDAQVADEIAKHADDKDYSYWFRFYSQQAKLVVNAVSREGSPEKIGAAVKALAPIDDQLAAFVKAKGGKLSSSFKTYINNATSFQAATTKLMRLLDAKKPLDDREVGAAADAVIFAYNQLVSYGNSLYQIEAVKNLKDE